MVSRRRKAALWLGTTTLFLMAAFGGAAMIPWDSVFLGASKGMGLALEECLIEGRTRTCQESIWQAVGIPWGESLWTRTPQAIKHAIESLPWVKRADVCRRLPHTLVIRLWEKKPLAIWQRQGQKILLSEEGDPIPVPPPTDASYMLITGEEAPRHAWELLKVLESHGKALKVRAAAFLRSQRWDLYLWDKTCIKLPEHNLASALERLLRVLAWREKTGQAIETIDVRFVDVIIVTPGAPAQQPTPGRPA